jgi:spermidine export protein MdtI
MRYWFFMAVAIVTEVIGTLAMKFGIWGGVGLVVTAVFGIVMFKERLRVSGWIGLGMIMGGVVLLKFV